ncbi:uncharacterized protein LOC134765303 [Penaeus indicus]|uniref:uncharacterized protein LOC134765303 n=1 Tax=Penaeus indicus TaxID=29960 RepID=UPI00300D81C9
MWKTELEENIDRWPDGQGKRGMEVSRAKTECMCLNGVPRGSVRIQDQRLPEVKEFKHLGSTLQADGGVNAEISRRIQSGWNNLKKMSGVLCDKRIPTRVKGKIHQTVIQPAMLYVLETVPQTNKTTKRLEVAEMKMCRWACGVTRRDRVRNEDIRRQMGVKNIGLRHYDPRSLCELILSKEMTLSNISLTVNVNNQIGQGIQVFSSDHNHWT